MTTEDILLLDSPVMRRVVEENMERDPASIALSGKIPHAALVATQVKYLQRARRKLPSYYRSGAVIPPLAFEQSSSEAAAANKTWTGDLCIDLTCGLGVDSLYLSHHFAKVISVEQSPELALAARINFSRLGASNIEVIESAAEDFMERFAACAGRADLIYADPDRRSGNGRKQVRLEECRPDITKMWPLLRKASLRTVVKLSPLFDVEEAFRIFGENCTAQAVSLGSECKEVLVETADDLRGQTVAAVAIGVGQVRYPFAAPSRKTEIPFRPPYNYMVIPDVSLRKARITQRYAADTLPESYSWAEGGYIFTNERPCGLILGRVFEVADMRRYRPAELKKELRARNISSVEIHTNLFPLQAPRIAARLGVKEGGEIKLAFTQIEGELWVIELKEITLQGECRGNTGVESINELSLKWHRF